jgi:hypothetical protein
VTAEPQAPAGAPAARGVARLNLGPERAGRVDPGPERGGRVDPGPERAGRVDPGREWVARGVAAVPGALAVPPPETPSEMPLGLPPSWGPLLPPPSVMFERPIWAGPTLTETPSLRTAVPEAEPEEPVEQAEDVAEPVREKGLLRRLGRRAALPAATAVAAAFVTGTTYLALTDGFGRPGAGLGRWGPSAAVTFPEAVQGAGNAGRPPGDPFSSGATLAQGAPTRVRVAAIGLDSPLATLHLGANGALQPPRQFDRAGWYADGTAPGDPGPAVIAGHVDSKAGPAVFYRLRELTAGDKIEVVRGGAVLRFTVTRTAWYPKSKFPTSTVYGPTPDRQLRLITCGGVFDHKLRSYKDNLVVYAVAG